MFSFTYISFIAIFGYLALVFCKGNKTSAKHKINLFIFALLSAKTLSKGYTFF